MKRTTPAALAVLALLALPALAQAKFITVGASADTTAPSCPRNCVAISRTTGYQVRVATKRNMFVVPRDGRIVAWTISLAKPSTNQVQFFDNRFGAASAGIVVLRPGRRQSATVVGLSPLLSLRPYFGSTIDVPLASTIAVRKGQIVALSVPTWAPALAVLGRRNDVSWRASRPSRCQDAATQSSQTAQTRLHQTARYGCLYQTARLTFSATLVTNPGK